MKKFKVLFSAALILGAGMSWAGTEGALSRTIGALTGADSFQLAQSCGSGLSVCSAGSYGPGGCYKPGYATCTAGLVCTGGMQACAPSNGGQPYCYKPGYGKCN